MKLDIRLKLTSLFTVMALGTALAATLPASPAEAYGYGGGRGHHHHHDHGHHHHGGYHYGGGQGHHDQEYYSNGDNYNGYYQKPPGYSYYAPPSVRYYSGPPIESYGPPVYVPAPNFIFIIPSH